MDVQQDEAFMAITETPLPWKAEADREGSTPYLQLLESLLQSVTCKWMQEGFKGAGPY